MNKKNMQNLLQNQGLHKNVWIQASSQGNPFGIELQFRQKPASLQHFLNKCTALQPKERPTMDEVLLKLKESLNPLPVVAAVGARCPPSLKRPEEEQTLECIFEGLSISKGSRSP